MSSSTNLNQSSIASSNLNRGGPPPPARHVPTDSTADYSPMKERGSFSITSRSKSSFGSKMLACFQGMFLCCADCDGDEGESDVGSGRATRTGSAKGMVISGPTNFRREEIHIAGLTPEQERLIRSKAESDAKKMWTNLQPLRSSPSGTFAARPPTSTSPMKHEGMILSPTYEEFTQPRSAPATPSSGGDRTPREGGARLKDRVKNQGRRMSGNFSGARIFSTSSGASTGREGRAASGGSGEAEGAGLGLGFVGGGGGTAAGGHQGYPVAGQAPLPPLPPTPPAVENIGDFSFRSHEG